VSTGTPVGGAAAGGDLSVDPAGRGKSAGDCSAVFRSESVPGALRWKVDSESRLSAEIAGALTAADRARASINRNGLGGGIDGEGVTASDGELCTCAERALALKTSDTASAADPRPPMPRLRDPKPIP